VPLIERYLAEGHPPDQPGRLVAWLYEREPVYGYRFDGEWYDIGSPEQLLEADNRWRERQGLPQRDEYSTLS
jgi:NDP-sugar pyrophosphorylase family protein